MSRSRKATAEKEVTDERHVVIYQGSFAEQRTNICIRNNIHNEITHDSLVILADLEEGY